MLVMMPMGTAPYAGGAEHEDADQSHQMLRSTRVWQYGVVLLIVVDDEKPQNQQSAQDAAGDLSGYAEVPKRTCKGEEQEGDGREDVPPAFECGVLRIPFGGEDQFGAGFYLLIQN